MIDIHTHLGKIMLDREPLTADILLSAMDKLGIEQSVILPLENPEETHYYVPTKEVIEICRKHPDRLIPFCGVDPRRGGPDFKPDFKVILKEYIEQGCRGFGEHLAGLPINDPRSIEIYKACGELGLPIILHIDRWRNTDSVHLPAFERVLFENPNTNFIAHGPGWWAEISSEVDPEITYPLGKVEPGGWIDYLFSRYPNLYADLSARSGYNALVRDKEFGVEFVRRNYQRLLFGTDYLYPEQDIPIVELIRNMDLTEEQFEAITRGNALELMLKENPELTEGDDN